MASRLVWSGPQRASIAGYAADDNVELLRSPFAPESLTAAVSGRTVRLQWRNPGDVSEFEVQAGSAPGDTDLSQRVGRSDTVTFHHGPPGTDYYRLISRSCFHALTPTGSFARTGSHGYTIQASVLSA